MTDYLDKLERDFGYMLTHTSGYVCPGWEQLIRDMLGDVHDYVKVDNEFYDISDTTPVFTDIKEKFGTLRVYGYNIDDEIQAILDRYAALSADTCMTCGKAGTMREKNRLLYVACEEHKHGH